MKWDIRGVCWCGATVRAVPGDHRRRLDEWAWEDGDGNRRVSSGVIEALQKIGGWEALARLDIGLYSNLKARMSLGQMYMEHSHSPTGNTVGGPTPEEVPWCHEEPMYLGVHEWTCRRQCVASIPHPA